MLAWGAVLVVAEALGGRPWRWFGGAGGGILVALGVVGVPTLLARRRYGTPLRENWLRARVTVRRGRARRDARAARVVVASPFADAVPLPRWLLSGPVAPAAGGVVGVAVPVAVERTG